MKYLSILFLSLFLIISSLNGRDLSLNSDTYSEKSIERASLLLSESRPDTALHIWLSARPGKSSDSLQIAYHILGAAIHLDLRRYNDSESQLIQAKKLIDNSSDSLSLATYLIYKARLLEIDGDREKAFSALILADKIFEKFETDRAAHAVVLNDMAIMMSQMNFLPEAVSFFLKAIDLNTELDTPEKLAMNYANLGVTYKRMGKVEEGLKIYRLAYKIACEQDQKVRQAQVLLNMGNLDLQLEHPAEAKKSFLRSLKICIATANDFGILLNYLDLAAVSNALHQPDSTWYYSNKAAALLPEFQNAELWRVHYENLRDGWEIKGVPDSVLYYYRLERALYDSLQKAQLKVEIAEIKAAYDAEKKERELACLQKDYENQKKRTLFISIALIIVTGLTMIITHLRLRLKKEKIRLARIKNDQLKSALEEKTREMVKNGEMLESLQKEMEKQSLHLNNSPFDFLKKVINSEQKFNWMEFEKHFYAVHPEFSARLSASFPSLTPGDIHLCMLIKMNLASKEIAFVTNTSIRSVDSARFRIRKKLELSKSQSLTSFLQKY